MSKIFVTKTQPEDGSWLSELYHTIKKTRGLTLDKFFEECSITRDAIYKVLRQESSITKAKLEKIKQVAKNKGLL